MNKTVPFDIESQIAYLTEKIKEYKKSSENNFKKSMIANIVAICLIPFSSSCTYTIFNWIRF